MSWMNKITRSNLAHFVARHTPLMDGVAKKLVPAKNPAQALAVARKLQDMGYHVCLHHLGLPTEDTSVIQQNVSQVVQIMEDMDDARLEVCLSLVPSELGYVKSTESGEMHCLEIAQKFSNRLSVRDVEDRQGYGDGLAVGERSMLMLHASERVAMQQLMALWAAMVRIGAQTCISIPAALTRSEEDVKTAISHGGVVRLSLFPHHVLDAHALVDVEKVEQNYLKLARILLSEDAVLAQSTPIFALETEELASAVLKLAQKEGWKADDFEFEVPYGVNNLLKKKLHKKGWRVRILVPFGKEWWPYYHRRTQD